MGATSPLEGRIKINLPAFRFCPVHQDKGKGTVHLRKEIEGVGGPVLVLFLFFFLFLVLILGHKANLWLLVYCVYEIKYLVKVRRGDLGREQQS